MNSFKAIYFQPEDEKKIDDLAFLKFLNLIRKEFSISELTPIEPLLFSGSLESLIKKVSPYNETLVFNSFVAVKYDIEGLKSLKESRIKFKFLDFPALTQETISTAIELIGLNGKTTNSSTSPFSNKRKSKRQTNKRILSGLTNKRNIEARKFIKKEKNRLAELKLSYTYSALAEALNKKGLKTARGKNFYAKSVERLMSKSREIDKYFQPNLAYEEAENTMEDNIKECSISRLKIDDEIDKYIEFKIKQPSQEPIEVILENNKKVIFRKEYPRGQRNVKIDIDEHYLLPGKHYLSVFFAEKKYNVKNHPLYLRKELKI